MKTKPLTERGQLYNLTGANFVGSVSAYSQALDMFMLQKELQEFIGRYEWVNLPEELDAQLIETMIYSKGQLSMFKLAGKYYILPFVYAGTVNQYGIQTQHIPIPYSGTIEYEGADKQTKGFVTAKDTMIFGFETGVDPENVGVILMNASSLYPARVYPPIALTDGIRSKLVENLILVRNNLILSQPIKYVSVETEAKAKSVQNQVGNLFTDILNGNVVQTLVGNLTLQDINSEAPKVDQQNIWQSFSSLDNLRMEQMGILNNGVFQKKERELTDEVAGTQSSSKLALQDGLNNRKRFCGLINKVWGLNVSVKLSEANQFTPDKEPVDGRAGTQVGLQDEPDV